jgi:prepilin-type N-terminal cleavage/methylation domain-containing protein
VISILIHNRIREEKGSARAEDGFTLVEVMIAIVLLVMISVAIYQATTQTFRYRAKLINEGDFYGGIRLSMGLLDRDVSALFSPVNLNPNNFMTTPDAVPENLRDSRNRPSSRTNQRKSADEQSAAAAKAFQLEELRRSPLGQPTDYWLGATDLTAMRPSRFIGEENRLQFVSASHMRVYKNSRESEYAKIVYELRDEKDSPLGDGIQVLVKVEDPNVFDDVEKKGGTAKLFPLLSGVKKFSFRYYRRDKKAWERTWDTNREDMKGLYPDIIELTLEVAGLSKLNFTGIYLFKPETPFYGMDPTL